MKRLIRLMLDGKDAHSEQRSPQPRFWKGLVGRCCALLSFAVAAGAACSQEPSQAERTSSVAAAVTSAATMIAAGEIHTCELLPAGTVQCWGDNGYGELGLGMAGGNHPTPVAVPGLTGVTAISGSTLATCALMSNQTVQCWGYGYGPSPVTITNLSGAVSVSVSGASWTHGCAVLSGGTVSCWGDNAWGQLGNGSSDTTPGSGSGSTAAVAVKNLTGAVAVQASAYGTCALLSNGTVQCWGDNSFGELGTGTTTGPSTCYAPYNWPCSKVPVAVQGVNSAVAIASGDGWHTCALLSNGTVSCWGDNSNGQLGDGTTTSRSAPVTVAGLSGSVTAIGAGELQSCAVISGGAVQCWGGNGSGQLGDGTTSDSSIPVNVVNVTGATAVSGGVLHSCALVSGGTVECWGQNTSGQLGDGTLVSSPVAQGANPGPNPIAVTAGWAHSCALLPNGTVQCWGDNSYGELGLGTVGGTHNTPATVNGVNATAISGSYAAECALLTDQTVKCWGYGYGPSPVAISGVTGAVGISSSGSSWSHSCAVLATGKVTCWGDNAWGQLGNGSMDTSPGSGANSTTPVPVSNLTTAVAVVAHAHGTCALLSNGTVQCWGANLSGELGIGTSTGPNTCYAPYNWPCSTVPAPVSGLGGVVALTAGDGDSVCALLSNGTVKCWGDNSFGQLGDGTTTARLAPVLVNGLGGVPRAIATGGDHSCAVLANGTVQCWGNNASGQLGNGSTTASSTPVTATRVADAMTVSAGGSHSCAVLAGAGGISCWGDNTYGQLGTGNTTSSSIPVASALTPHGSQQLAGYYKDYVAAGFPLVGPVPLNATVQLGIGLPARDPRNDSPPMPLLNDFITQVSTPGNSLYHHYLTPAQFASTYGAPASDYNNLVAWAQNSGLTVMTSPNTTLVLDVSGPVSAVQQALFANLNYYRRPDGSLFYAVDREPSLNPPSLTAGVLRISGLDSAFVPVPTNPGSDMASGGGLSAGDLRNAYVPCAPQLKGQGQTVALLSLAGFNGGDIAAYQGANNIPANPPVLVNLHCVGSVFQCFRGIAGSGTAGNPDFETTQDIEMVNALAPAAQVAVFEGPQNGTIVPGCNIGTLSCNTAGTTNDIFWAMTDSNSQWGPSGLPQQISTSYLFDADDNTRQVFAKMAAQGQTLFVTSGDEGAYGLADGWTLDATLPYVTVVGGTALTMQGTGGGVCNAGASSCSYSSESVWNVSNCTGNCASGGGIFNLPLFPPPIPTWQQGLATAANLGSTTTLMAPDVSAAAQNIAVFYATTMTQNGGGTSSAAPLWAGYAALANEHIADTQLTGPLGFATPALYAIAKAVPSAFHDVTVGSNSRQAGSNVYPATPGYDLATGLGTPTCPLLNQLASGSPATPFTCPPSSSACGLVCCTGTCNNFVCTPAPTFQITVGVKALQTFGADVCVSGTGFTKNGTAQVTITGIPTANGGTTFFSQSGLPVDSSGNLSAFFPEVANQVICASTPGKITVTAMDQSTFQTAPAVSVAGCEWCANAPFKCTGVGTCQ